MLLKIVMSKSQQLLLAPPLPDQLQSYRQPLRMRSSWNGNGRKSGQGCLNGKNIGQVHNDRVICFFAQFESRGWRCRKKHKIVGLQQRSEEHTSELQSLMRISYAVFCLKKKKKTIS